MSENTNVSTMPASYYNNNNSKRFNIYIDDLNIDILAEYANMFGTPQVVGSDASANVSINVPLNVFKPLFVFSLNPTEAEEDDLSNNSDISYHLMSEQSLQNLSNWIDDSFNDIFNLQIIQGRIDNSTSPPNQTIGHDFVRYLAAKLFNTYQAVDLFSNEYDIRNSISDFSYNNFKINLENNYSTTSFKVLSSVLQSGSRFVDLSGTFTDGSSSDISFITQEQGVNGRVYNYAPLLANDTIAFKLIISPAVNQNDLTGVEYFGARVYRVELVMT